ncbi:hypothetical protein D3C79_916260 [compost metagenome]
MGIGLQQQLDAVGVVGRSEGQPAVPAQGDVMFGHEAEHVVIESQGLGLVVDKDAGDHDLHRHTPFAGARSLLVKTLGPI